MRRALIIVASLAALGCAGTDTSNRCTCGCKCSRSSPPPPGDSVSLDGTYSDLKSQFTNCTDFCTDECKSHGFDVLNSASGTCG